MILTCITLASGATPPCPFNNSVIFESSQFALLNKELTPKLRLLYLNYINLLLVKFRSLEIKNNSLKSMIKNR